MAFIIGRVIGALFFTFLAAALWKRVLRGDDARTLAYTHGLAFVTATWLAGMANLDGRPWSALAVSAMEVAPVLLAAQMFWFAVGWFSRFSRRRPTRPR